MSIRIIYSSSSLISQKTKLELNFGYLLYHLSLDTVDMYTLADLEDVLSVWRINNKYLPGSRHQSTSEYWRHYKNDTNIEDYKVRSIAREETRQDLLLKDKEAKSLTRENIIGYFIDFCLVACLIE